MKFWSPRANDGAVAGMHLIDSDILAVEDEAEEIARLILNFLDRRIARQC